MMLDFRTYDVKTGRFFSVDPLYESMPGYTPYHYSFNNPVRFKDGSGLLPEKEKGDKILTAQIVLLDDDMAAIHRMVNDLGWQMIFDLCETFGIRIKFCANGDVILIRACGGGGGGSRKGIYSGLKIKLGTPASWTSEEIEKLTKELNETILQKQNETGVEWGYFLFTKINEDNYEESSLYALVLEGNDKEEWLDFGKPLPEDFQLNGNEYTLGYVHTHPSTKGNPCELNFFSPDDLASFAYYTHRVYSTTRPWIECNKYSFGLVTECGTSFLRIPEHGNGYDFYINTITRLNQRDNFFYSNPEEWFEYNYYKRRK